MWHTQLDNINYGKITALIIYTLTLIFSKAPAYSVAQDAFSVLDVFIYNYLFASKITKI